MIELDPKLLKPTEAFIESHLLDLISLLSLSTEKWPPLIISENYFILDGHHRHQIAISNRLPFIPARIVDYNDARVQVYDYNDGTLLDKITLMRVYQSGVLLKPKTTRHIVEIA